MSSFVRVEQKRVEISRDFNVGDEWIELSGQLLPRKHGVRRHVYLVIDGYKFDPTDPEAEAIPIKIDGQAIELYLFVIDSTGNRYPTEDTTRWGNTIGLSIGRDDAGKTIGPESEDVKIAIRSNVAFRCKSIGFRTHRMK